MVITLDGIVKVLGGETHLRRAVSHATQIYGQNFCTRLAGLKPPAPWPSDVRISFADSPDLMSPDVSRGLLKRVRRDHPEAENVHELEQEVATGRCVLRENADSIVERVVFLVAFRMGDGGDTLWQLGSIGQDGTIQKGNLELPGTKCARDEPADQARARALSNLGILADYIKTSSEHEELREHKSKHFNIPTQYRIAENRATLINTRRAIDEALQIQEQVAEPPASFKMTVRSTKSFLSLPSKLSFNKLDIPTVYVIPKSRGEIVFYAWLSEETRKQLLQDNDNALQKYLDSLTYQDLGCCYRI